MAQMSQDDILARSGICPAEFLTHTKNTSVLMTMLPAIVRSRLPRIPSIRRSVSMYGLANRHKISSGGSRHSSGRSSTSSWTPDAGIANAMVLSDTRNLIEEEETTDYFFESASSDDECTTGFRASKGKNLEMEVLENNSGIGWKFANQGLNLLSLAVQESSTITHSPKFGNASFARQLYIHALTYLLRALPEDLSAEEKMGVRGALPPGIVESQHLNSVGHNGPHSSSIDQPSLLHRTLATTIIQLFILVQFILPYLKYWLKAAYQYDREHKISEKVLSQSIETVDSLGKTGLNLTGAIYGMGDGRVGQIITDTAAWLVEGVTGGIHEGVGEGMVIIGATPRRSSSPKAAERR